jgi:LysM repeat protein
MVQALQARGGEHLQPTPTDTGTGGDGEYRVQPGDTLSRIAASHGVSVASLLQANPQIRDANLIYPGDIVHLPGHARVGAGDYTVRSGDTLSDIARSHGVSLQELERANPQIANPDVLYPGDVVHVPPSDPVTPSGPHGGPGPTAGAAPVATPTAPTANGDRTREAMDYFVGQGWTRQQAAGIVANLQTESGLQPNARGDGGLAYGIGQWHPDRQAAFQAFTGRSIQGSSYEDQLRFVQHELTHSESGAGSRLHRATSAYDAGGVVSRDYERPADREGEAARRGRAAERILRGYP